jgi:hypothetical protein
MLIADLMKDELTATRHPGSSIHDRGVSLTETLYV